MPASDSERPAALVIGDAMVDAYLDARPVGVSDEAPVMTLDWVAVTRSLGGMLNVARALAELGFNTTTIGRRGDDETSAWVEEECARFGFDSKWIHTPGPTIEKTRIVADADHLARVDREQVEPLDESFEAELGRTIDDAVGRADVIVVSDYDKGFMAPWLVERLMAAGRRHSAPVVVDTKPACMDRYRGARLLTPNEFEARQAAEWLGESTEGDVMRIGERLVARLEADVLVTRGAGGMTLIRQDGPPIEAPSANTTPASTSGAGDVVLAVCAAAIAAGDDADAMVRRSTRLVGRAMSRPGTCRITLDDLHAEV
ncbi:MAG: bifunctional heptose 7-phosphate kinase/heptose 1-phosphate adenyltransferase [Phycisphaerales bacterium]